MTVLILCLKKKTIAELKEIIRNLDFKIPENVKTKSDIQEEIRLKIDINMIHRLLKIEPIKNWKEYAIYKQKERIQEFCRFVDPIGILMMMCYTKRNVIFLDHDTRKLVYEETINKNYPTIVFDYTLNFHYELYVMDDPKNDKALITEFNHDDRFLIEIRKNGGYFRDNIGYYKYTL